jgi:hypothetical protein
MSLSTDEAARILGVASHEIERVECRDGGWFALQHDMASHATVWRHVPGHELAASAVAEEGPEEVAPVGDADGDGVPDGAVAEVLDWVGDDSDRAVRAIEAEEVREKPRTTLISALEKLIG